MGSNKLTDKQEKYVQNLLLGQSQREAYKNSYNASNMKDRTIDNKASLLITKEHVRGRYDELRGKVMKKIEERNLMTASDVLDRIETIIKDNQSDDPKTALKGLELYGKHLKLFTDKVEHSGEISLPNFSIKGK